MQDETAATKVAVSGSFARALKAMASVLRGRNRGDSTTAITREWFASGPAVRYDEYHLDTLKPYVEHHTCSAEE